MGLSREVAAKEVNESTLPESEKLDLIETLTNLEKQGEAIPTALSLAIPGQAVGLLQRARKAQISVKQEPKKKRSSHLSKFGKRGLSSLQTMWGIKPLAGCRVPGFTPVQQKSLMVWDQRRESQQAKQSDGYLEHLSKNVILPTGLSFADGNSTAAAGILRIGPTEANNDSGLSGRTDAIIASTVGIQNNRPLGSLRCCIDLKIDASRPEYEAVMLGHLIVANLRAPHQRPFIAITDGQRYGRLFWLDGVQPFSWVVQAQTEEDGQRAMSEFYSILQAEVDGTLMDPAQAHDLQEIEGQAYVQSALRRRAVFPAVVRDGSEASDATDTSLDLADFDEFISKESQLVVHVEEAVAFLACH